MPRALPTEIPGPGEMLESIGAGDLALRIADAVFAAGSLIHGRSLDATDVVALTFARGVLSGAAAFQRGEAANSSLPLTGAGTLDTINAVATDATDSNSSAGSQAEALAEMLGRYLENAALDGDRELLQAFRERFVALAQRTLVRASEGVSHKKEPMRWSGLSSTSGL